MFRTSHRRIAQALAVVSMGLGAVVFLGWLAIIFTGFHDSRLELVLATAGCAVVVSTSFLAVRVCRHAVRLEERRLRVEVDEQHSRLLVSATIDALSAHIAVLDARGRILMVNEAWRRFSGENEGDAAGTGVGVNYLDVCARAAATDVPEARALHDGIAEVVAGRRATFEMEYPCHAPNVQRWFLVRVTRLGAPGSQVVVAHENISNLRRAVEALQETERRFRSAFEYSGIGMALVSLEGRFMSVNRALGEILGYREEELTQLTFQQLTHPEDLKNDLQHAGALGRGEIRSYQIEKRYIHKSGRMVPILLCGSAVRDAAGKPQYFIAQVQDISARKAAAAERDRFFTLSLDLLCIAGTDGYFKRVNPAFQDTLGWSDEELLSRSMFEFIHPDDRERTRLVLQKMAQTERPTVNFQNRYRCRDGSYRWLSWSSRPYPAEALVYAVARDVTRERTDHSRLLQSLQQKDVLLREIHHRVKNNLQVMSSLLQLQARHARNGAVEKLLAESQSRLRAMSLLHEKLYRQENMAAIDLAEYIPGMVRTLGQSLGSVELRVDIAPCMVSIETALPLGLIINELVSNSFKHAMPRTEQGWVAVSLQPKGERLVLLVADNGPGLPGGVEVSKLESLGLKLVTLLSAQLGATPHWSSRGGLRFELEFAVADSSLQSDSTPTPVP